MIFSNCISQRLKKANTGTGPVPLLEREGLGDWLLRFSPILEARSPLLQYLPEWCCQGPLVRFFHLIFVRLLFFFLGCWRGLIWWWGPH